MPTYEYRCKSCGEHLEVVQSFKDQALTVCPACGEEQLRKVFGNIGISFKGSGFYKTDSRAAAKSSSSSSSTGSTSTSSSSSSESSSAGSSSSESSSSSSSSSSAFSPSPSSGSKPAAAAS